MLYKYKKINHKIDSYHVWIRHLVLDVWCRASIPFSTNLLLPEFAVAVNAMPANYLLNKIAHIHNQLIHKPKRFKRMLHDGFRKNNSIEALCNGNIQPLQYSAIRVVDEKFANDLYIFCVSLYDRLSKEDTRIRAAFDGINNHYNAFFANGNNAAVCPFCGISKLLNSHNSKREAYDHFFPKEIYPFTTVNFENLVPMCHSCNSKYKTRKDPINLRNGGPIKVIFYPFSNGLITNIEISFTFNSADLINLTPQDIDIDITSNNSPVKVTRWKEIFGIEERYKAICCDESAFKGWLEEYNMFTQVSDISFDNYIATKNMNKYLNQKFLESAYLKGCRNIGVI